MTSRCQPSTLYTVVESWAQNSAVGQPKERTRFVNEHIKGNFDNTLEILLRLTRGDRSGNVPVRADGSPLTSALSENAFHAAQQTHTSLAVLSLFRMTTEYAEAAGEDMKVLEHRVCEIIRSLPPHLVNRSLDYIFKDWWAAERAAGSGKRN